MNILSSFIKTLRVGKRSVYKNLAIYPVYGRAEEEFVFITLDEAMAEGYVKIKESDIARVPELVVTNSSGYDLLIVQGEELIGAKQNRTVNATVVVPAKCTISIPVSCTESGRWREGKSGVYMHKSSPYCSIPSVRSSIADSVSSSLKSYGDYSSDQREVWESISRNLRFFKVSSQTEAQADMYENKKEEVKTYINAFGIEPEQCGIISEVNHRLYCAEFFCQPEIFAKLHKKLVSSLAMEALVRKKADDIEEETDPEDFLKEIENSTLSQHDAPGKGVHILIEGKRLKGMVLAIGEKIVHLYGFRASQGGRL